MSDLVSSIPLRHHTVFLNVILCSCEYVVHTLPFLHYSHTLSNFQNWGQWQISENISLLKYQLLKVLKCDPTLNSILTLYYLKLCLNPLPDMPILGSSNSMANKDMKSKIKTNGDTVIWLSWKYCWKNRNCSLAISPFPTMFSKAVCCWCVKISIYEVKGFNYD